MDPGATSPPSSERSPDAFDRHLRTLALGPSSEEDEALARLEARLFGQQAPSILRGRYVLLERRGSGSGGVVYRAYDPRLDRQVALKLLRHRDRPSPRAAHRLEREAQALAKLKHPNVVTVYDVGVHGGRLFVAMEFVEGQTMREWLGRAGPKPRSWRAILSVFQAAARALAAVHDAGLVHRDFKPENVMIDTDGVARVMDFGLVAGPEHLFGGSTSDERQTPEDSNPQITRTNALVGTPAYMAPEQLEGGRASPASDQFSFCVALHEALFGARPYPKLSDELPEQPMALPPARARRVPAWLRAVVAQGLAPDPRARHRDMQALSHALEAGESRRRRRRVVALLAAGLALVAAPLLVEGERERQHLLQCEAAGDPIAEVWSPRARAELLDTLLATKLSYADEVGAQLERRLDDHTRRWRADAALVCDRAVREPSWDAAQVDKANWCLERRRIELEALLIELGRGGKQSVDRALELSSTLSPSASCVDPMTLAAQPSAPALGARGQVLRLHRDLSQARFLNLTGEHDEAGALARAVRGLAETQGWGTLAAAARLREGQSFMDAGRHEEALAPLRAAYYAAAKRGGWTLATEAALELGAAQMETADYDGFRDWMRHAGVAAKHAGDPEGSWEARIALSWGVLALTEGEFDLAERHFRRTLELYEANLDPHHPDLAVVLNNLGGVYFLREDYGHAAEFIGRSLEIRERALGPGHPGLGYMLTNLGTLEAKRGNDARARELLTRSVEVRTRGFGPEHPDTATSHHALGDFLVARGEPELGLEHLRRASEIVDGHPGVDRRTLAIFLAGEAKGHAAGGDLAKACARLERALRIFEDERADGHESELKYPEYEALLGRYRLREGETEAALGLLQSALRSQREVLDARSPALAQTLVDLGDVHLARTNWSAAERAYAEAEAIYLGTPGAPQEGLARARAGLSRARGGPR
ncbi:serine/threonine kinase family protein [Plesiocystis pacifica SIR-1]|uniref:Serine/threonine kinase family protein n=1 Tax=Plesiocystis pacifica SIR-1 TaxID=391625 RepID=A6G483_9BACT|nr:serine/threonine-protein kinase [Plesiocystis pacifica]EDM79406.1 serine/threonine kinase family protein [Plesiocystis pacifica SIR-1]